MANTYPTKDTLKINGRYWAAWKTCWLWYRGERYHGQDEEFHYYFEDIYGRITDLREGELPALMITK